MMSISIHPARLPRVLAVALLAIALTAAGVVAATGSASAHANIDRAEPAPDSTLPTAPSVVRIWFTEPVVASASAIEVLDSTGRRVDTGNSRVDLANPMLMTVGLPALPDGTYTVAWHNTSSADGHPLRSTYAFTVGLGATGTSGRASATSTAISGVSPFDPFVRWAALTGLLVALGVEWFALVVLSPALAQRELRSANVEVSRRVVGGALAIFAIASLVHLGLQLRDGTGVVAVLTGGRWGQMWLLRAVLVLLATGTWSFVRDRRGRIAATALLADAACTFAFASHAAGLRDLQIAAVANDLLHTLAAAVWAGGLVALLAVVLASRAQPEGMRRALLAGVTRRFSPIAMLATGVLLITGTYTTWLEVASRDAFATPYGYAVAAKVVIFATLIVVAALNLLWITRRLREVPRAAAQLRASVSVEVTLVLAALLAAGFLTSLQPAREAFGQGARTAEVTSGAVRVQLAVSPGSLGANRIELRVDRNGRLLTDSSTNVTLRAQYTGADLGAIDVELKRDASGAYVANGVVLSLQGTWQFDVAVSSPGIFDTQAGMRLPIAPAGVTGIALPQQTTALLAAGWQVVLLALLVLVVAEAFWKGTRTAQVANWSGTALVVAGILMVYGVGHFHQGTPPAVGGAVNPILPSDASVALGRTLYAQHCVACHGPFGLGDGPAGVALNPPPASLPSHVPLHSDGDLFAFVSAGFPGSAMPAFKGTLTDEQIWHLVNYLHTLKLPGSP